MLKASVILRSYNRVDAALEAADRLRQQDYPSFEIVLIEQTPSLTPAQSARLRELERDPRCRVIRRPPLGGPGSRNEGVRQAVGDVIVFLDDDDLPGGSQWLSAHMRNFEDPLCLAVTGRHLYPGDNDRPYWNMAWARRKVLTFSPLMWQRCYARIDTRSTRAQNILGTNSSIRRTAIEQFGLWDECTRVEDEASFCFRMLEGKRPEEYIVFDPLASIERRFDIAGGLDKRAMTTAEYGGAIFQFFHNIVAHYHPVRFVLLYPFYIVLLGYVSIAWVVVDSRRYRTPLQKALASAELLLMLPFRWVWWLAAWTTARIRHGPPHRFTWGRN